MLLESRAHYTQNREHFLKYIEHPEALTEVSIDPLADDLNVSPSIQLSA